MNLVKRISAAGLAVAGSGGLFWMWAQERPTFRIKVDMVVLSFTVTDSKGRYINGLKPSDVKILEDGIPQKINTFGEGKYVAQFRVEFFNAFNTPQFAAPGQTLGSSNFGVIGGTAINPRQIQLALKLFF